MSAGTDRFYVRAVVGTTGAHSYSQRAMLDDFAARVAHLPGAGEVLPRIRSVFENSAVDTRHLELSIEEIDRRRRETTWHPIVRDALFSLGRRALTRLFERTGVDPKECDALVVVASCWDGFPGPSRRLVEALGFRDDALFYDVATLACGGANHGLNLAQMMLATGQRRNVCVLVMEALNTHIQGRGYESATSPPGVSEIVSRVLPSDGACALLLTTERPSEHAFSYAKSELRVRAWKDSADYMVATTAPDGQPLGSIGKDIRTRLVDESMPLVGDGELDDPICIHPGGIALVRRLAEVAPNVAPSADISLGVLRENGNMSAPTVLFVLEKTLAARAPITPRLRLLAFGPGVYTTLYGFHDVERG